MNTFTIVFIGPEGRETWIGTKKGFRDAYPKAKIVIYKPFKK